MKLFVIYIGGTHPKALIELHDMRFVAAESIEDTYEELKRSWWGIPESLHLDAWGVLEYADGYAVHLATKPPEKELPKLYFVNLGGYDNSVFSELHKNIFVVANSESSVKINALKQVETWKAPHKDYQYDIDCIVDVAKIATSENRYIHLIPIEKAQEFKFVCQYVPIGKKSLASGH